MNKADEKLLNSVINNKISDADAYNIRKNGKSIDRKETSNIKIISKEDGTGIDIYVKDDTLFSTIDIPVILNEKGLIDTVYNDFHIGKNANVSIIAGCGIHNDYDKLEQHNGIHRFFLEENSKVRYYEKHYGEGTGKKVLNPITEIAMKKNSYMEMETVQIKGVDDTLRITKAKISDHATLIINEKILTDKKQIAKTSFKVDLKGNESSCHVVSRSVATDNSYQEFLSNIIGYKKCFGHIECDAIIKDKGSVKAIPSIYAKSLDASLTHEASIGKIAGDQFQKLMSLGLNSKEAEETIIKGFLK